MSELPDEYGPGSEVRTVGPITILSMRSDTAALLHEVYAQWEAFYAERLRRGLPCKTPEDLPYAAFYWLFRHSGFIQYGADEVYIPKSSRREED